MVFISDTSIPRLAPKVRVKWDHIRQKYLLLFPERCTCAQSNSPRDHRNVQWTP